MTVDTLETLEAVRQFGSGNDLQTVGLMATWLSHDTHPPTNSLGVVVLGKARVRIYLQ